MKKILLTLAMAGAVAGSVSAQGIIPFAASGSPAPGGGQIKYTTTGLSANKTDVPTGNPDNVPGYGQINLAFYAASNGTVLTLLPSGLPDLSAWKIQTSALIHQIAPFAGASPQANQTMDATLGPGGTTLEVELVAWTGSFTDFASAAASGTALVGFSGSALSGGAFGWSQATGTAQAPVTLVTGAGGFAGITVSIVPEPATMVLGGLGAAALLLFRRRK